MLSLVRFLCQNFDEQYFDYLGFFFFLRLNDGFCLRFFLPKIGIYLIINLIFNFRFGGSMCSNFYCDDWFWTLRTLRAIHLTLQSNRDWKWCQSKWFRTSGWNQESKTDAFLTVFSIFYAFFMLYLSWNSVSLSSILNVVVSGSVNLAHIIWRLYYGHFLHF